jgi:hypothetical protein
MALNAATFTALLRADMLSRPALNAVDSAALTALCDSIATILPYIVANAVATTPPGVAVATTGTAAAQTGATTAPGVGSIT